MPSTGERIYTDSVRKMIMKSAVQQRLKNIQNAQEKHLACQAEDHGWSGHIKCLEDSKEGMACRSRIPFGFGFLCDNTEKIEWMRNWKKTGYRPSIPL